MKVLKLDFWHGVPLQDEASRLLKNAGIKYKWMKSISLFFVFSNDAATHSCPVQPQYSCPTVSHRVLCSRAPRRWVTNALFSCSFPLQLFSGFEPMTITVSKFTSLSSRPPPPNSSDTVFHFHGTELLAVACVIMCMTVTNHYEFIRLSSGDSWWPLAPPVCYLITLIFN